VPSRPVAKPLISTRRDDVLTFSAEAPPAVIRRRAELPSSGRRRYKLMARFHFLAPYQLVYRMFLRASLPITHGYRAYLQKRADVCRV
jgi:hypothetical protein